VIFVSFVVNPCAHLQKAKLQPIVLSQQEIAAQASRFCLVFGRQNPNLIVQNKDAQKRHSILDALTLHAVPSLRHPVD
jgi:hypothetical protein